MAPPLLLSLASVLLILSAGWFVQRLQSRKKSLTYPPGPPGKFIIGNASDIPKTAMAQSIKYTEWKETYGPLLHLDALGTHLIIINDMHIAVDLLDKRGAIYSARPHMTMVGELCGWKRMLVFSQPDELRFKEMRRCLAKLFSTRESLEQHYPVLEAEIHAFVRRTIAEPERYVTHIRKSVSAITLRIAYGYRPLIDSEDPVLKVVEEGMVQTNDVFTQVFLVDILPWMQYLPNWFPGAGFKKLAKYYHQTLDGMCDFPYRTSRKNIRDGTAEPCFVQRQIDEGQYTPDKEEWTKWTATSIYGAGTDTTISSLCSFFLAMTIYPDVLKKAQAEIDRVLGCDRLPTLADRANLPYVDALQREVMRWNPVGPLAIPHGLSEDDVYKGYLLPKGAIVITNLWHFLNNEDTYKNPREFNPDRFIATPKRPVEKDPRELTFGFGRRACPGINLADAMIWLYVAVAVATLDISRARDASGNEIVPEGKYDDGLVMMPVSFPCVVKTRNTAVEGLLHAAV